MIFFESDLHSLYAVGAGLAIGLPLRYLVIKGTTALINRLTTRSN